MVQMACVRCELLYCESGCLSAEGASDQACSVMV